MQITPYTGCGQVSQRRQSATQDKPVFGDLIAAAAQKQQPRTFKNAQDRQLYACRISNMLGKYHEWHKSRPPVNVPNSDGWNDENIQYLEARYAGEFGTFEKIEALRTMFDIGCITPEQYQDAVGLGAIMTTSNASEITVSCGPLEPDGWNPFMVTDMLSGADWEKVLESIPVSRVDTLDALFELLEHFS